MICRPQVFKAWRSKYFQIPTCSQQLALKWAIFFSGKWFLAAHSASPKTKKAHLCRGKLITNCKGLSVKSFPNSKLLKSILTKDWSRRYSIPSNAQDTKTCQRSAAVSHLNMDGETKQWLANLSNWVSVVLASLVFSFLTFTQNSHCNPSIP